MLAPDDAALVARDRAVTGLACLLDPERLGEALRKAMPEAGVESAQPGYMRYKPGTSCVAAFDIVTERGTIPAYAATHVDARKQRKMAERHPVATPFGPATFGLAGEPIAVALFPHDHALRTLWPLAHAEGRAKVLKALGLVPQGSSTWIGLRYKPERRYVARLDVGERPHGVVKFHAPDRFELALRGATHCRATDALCIAPILGSSAAHGAIAHGWIHGSALGGVEAARTSAELIGTALAELHAQSPPAVAPEEHDAADRACLESCMALSALDPELGALARRVARTAADRADLPSLDGAVGDRVHVPVHGDLDLGQMIRVGGRIALLDLDRLRAGARCEDLACLLARSIAADPMSDGGDAASFAQEIATAYRRVSGHDVRPRLTSIAAVRLVLEAVEPFRRRVPAWRADAARILSHAQELLHARAVA